MQETNCNLSVAKAWTIHHVPVTAKRTRLLSALWYAIADKQSEAVSILRQGLALDKDSWRNIPITLKTPQ